jgi:hypothetical protein
MTKLSEYLVVWRGEDGVLQSLVKTNADPETLTNDDWVWLAANSEGMSGDAVLKGGYDLYLVCPFPSAFYES